MVTIKLHRKRTWTWREWNSFYDWYERMTGDFGKKEKMIYWEGFDTGCEVAYIRVHPSALIGER